MRIVQEIFSPTQMPKDGPNALSEWCCNMGVFDPFAGAIFASNEDSYVYRWDLNHNTLAERIEMRNPFVEAYTPSLIGPDGAVYSINMGQLSVIECNKTSQTIGTATVEPTQAPAMCKRSHTHRRK